MQHGPHVLRFIKSVLTFSVCVYLSSGKNDAVSVFIRALQFVSWDLLNEKELIVLHCRSFMANSSRVAEIFQQASVAFGRLAQLTIDLKLAQVQKMNDEQKENMKWTSTEVGQLKEAVARFGNDLGKIAEVIETKTLAQIKEKVKGKSLRVRLLPLFSISILGSWFMRSGSSGVPTDER